MSMANATRVFVAEDDPAILELVILRLEIAGYRTGFARDGASALHQIRYATPAAVILDVNMPRLDGFSVLRALRAHPPSARTPVLMLTARQSAADIKMARDYGADDYLVKPFDDQRLLTRVDRMLRVRRASAARA